MFHLDNSCLKKAGMKKFAYGHMISMLTSVFISTNKVSYRCQDSFSV